MVTHTHVQHWSSRRDRNQKYKSAEMKYAVPGANRYRSLLILRCLTASRLFYMCKTKRESGGPAVAPTQPPGLLSVVVFVRRTASWD